MSIGLYIHVPFCVRKCRYCAFVSYPGDSGAVGMYMEALKREMEMRAERLAGITVETVYIGGGTPTFLSGKDLAEIMDWILSYYNVSAGAEVTVEANPGTVDREKLSALRSSGVNRLSMGFQACRRDLLATLGRIHSYPEAVAGFLEARLAGFDNIGVDLIFGIPGQDPDGWRECLRGVADLRPDHISAYGLQLEEETPLFAEVRSGLLEACQENQEADMFEDLMEILGGLGYIHYEISNFALPGKFCRHNLLYWKNLNYLGLGPAAHSYLDGRRFSNETLLNRYARSINAGKFPVCRAEEADRGREMSETVFMGLRLIDGLDLEAFRERFGVGMEDVYGEETDRLAGLGLVEVAEGRLRLTRRGVMLGNRVFSEFV